jgi:hypothetical protein
MMITALSTQNTATMTTIPGITIQGILAEDSVEVMVLDMAVAMEVAEDMVGDIVKTPGYHA